MIILTAIGTAQSITTYVREHTNTTYTLTVIDESLNSTDSNVVGGTTTDGVFTSNVTYDFIEGRFYGLKVYSGSDLINFSKIYVTDQSDLENYSVIDDYYTQISKAETTYITKE